VPVSDVFSWQVLLLHPVLTGSNCEPIANIWESDHCLFHCLCGAEEHTGLK